MSEFSVIQIKPMNFEFGKRPIALLDIETLLDIYEFKWDKMIK